MDQTNQYDLFVIGSGPGGQRAAIQAAKLGKRVGLAEEKGVVGGVRVNLGTIPSKTLREAVLSVSRQQQQKGYGTPAGVAQSATIADLLRRVNVVVENELDVGRHQLERNGVELHWRRASFTGSHTLRLDTPDGLSTQEITARHIVIATGTRVTEDPHIPFDGRLLGGFKWSSQRLEVRGCDGKVTGVGGEGDRKAGDAVSRPSTGCAS